MAVQTGVGLSKILILAGAGYTGTVILRNGKLSDVLSELQQLLKGLDKSEDSSSTDSDALAAHVRRLAMEVRKLASERSIIINGNSSQMGNLTSLAMPAVVLGALGYGYMWWKGFSFSDLMYVTKQNMQTAVQSMTKHLEQVSAALASTKKHLTQRIENLDGKLDEQKDISKLIKNEVIEVRTDLSQIGYDLDTLQKLVCGLDGKIGTLEDKQDFANAGVWYLCQFIGSKDGKMPDFLQSVPKPKRSFLGYSETKSLKGLKDIADVFQSGSIDSSNRDGITQNAIDVMDTPKSLSRTASIKC